jgi:hypothetical protein
VYKKIRESRQRRLKNMTKIVPRVGISSVVLFLILSFWGFSGAIADTIVTVPGTSDPWLAGMPNGSTASGSTASASDGDVAPDQSPVLVGSPFSPGDIFTFSPTGLTDHCTGGACGLAGPEGDFQEGSTPHFAGAENGIASLTAPIDSLIGVFLGAAQPDSSAAPGALDFSTLSSRDFSTLSPLLKQPFFIGDGRRNDGLTVQSFIAPPDATRLFLGTVDGFGWYSNVGSFEVTVDPQPVPEPASMLLLATGLMGLVGLRRKLRK